MSATRSYENDVNQFLTSDGSGLVTLAYPPGSIEGAAYQWMVGLKVFFNETEYTIATVQVNETNVFVRKFTTTPSFPANLAILNIDHTAVDIGADEITTPSNHGLVSGDIMSLNPHDGSSTVPAGYPGGNFVYVIKTANNKFKIATTHANALAGVAVNLTSQGTGSTDMFPAWFQRFSSCRYDGNTATTMQLSSGGTSQIVSTANDKLVASVSDTNYTADLTAGTITYPSLTAARTVTLPTAVGLRGKEYIIKDRSGAAGTYTIIVDGNGAETIDGSATAVINKNYGVLKVKSDGANWFIVQAGHSNDIGVAVGTSLNLGTATLLDILTATAALDFDLSATAAQDLTVTVTGAAVGDTVALGVPNGSVTTDTFFNAWVSAPDTVTVRAIRISGTPNPASGTFRVTVLKL
jgi:hypothetical protein